MNFGAQRIKESALGQALSPGDWAWLELERHLVRQHVHAGGDIKGYQLSPRLARRPPSLTLRERLAFPGKSLHHECRPALSRHRRRPVRAPGLRAQPATCPRFVGHLDAKIPSSGLEHCHSQTSLGCVAVVTLMLPSSCTAHSYSGSLTRLRIRCSSDHAVDGIHATE